jgi:hypothetical protein
LFFDIGLTPIVSLLITTLLFAILSDLVLELYSVRVSLSSGRLQRWFFVHFGQNLFLDYLFAIVFQFLSFRKKNFLLQISSLVNVGSFQKKQVVVIVLGSLIGLGLSMLLFTMGWQVGSLFCVLSFLFGFVAKDQIKDFSIGLLTLGIFLLSINLFNDYLLQSSFPILQFHFAGPFAIGIVLFSTICFRTPMPFFIFLSTMYCFGGLNLLWLPFLFFLHSAASNILFYMNLFAERKRIYFLMFVVFLFQITQLVVTMALFKYTNILNSMTSLIPSVQFLNSFYLITGAFIIYNSISLLFLSPLVFLLTQLPYFNRPETNKDSSQKIIVDPHRGRSFSIHISLYLLRQEFKKYAATVHTIFKMSRESDTTEEKINAKISRYQSILRRVGDELKDVCFSIGRERSYRWQVREVMNTYRLITQLELLIDDLSRVIELLQEKEKDSDWEKDCRLWLSIQLKIFESFFYEVVGVEYEYKDKIREEIEKSYKILERSLAVTQSGLMSSISAQTFYRVTDSLMSLNRIGR